MQIRFQTWRRFIWIAGFLAIPAALFLFVQPDFGEWSRRLEIASYIFIFGVGCLGGLLAILTRVGVVQFIYSDADKRTMAYRMSRLVAEMEQSHGRGFSDTYYESLGVRPPKKKDSDETPAA